MPTAPNGVRPDNAPAFASAPPPLTRAELVEVYEIWKLLGPMATARAAAIATREQVLEAVELVALMRTEPVGPRWADYNMAFHVLIENFGSGPRLGAILTELRGLASGFVRQSILASADQRLDEANSEHEEILRAVIAGDAEGAADAALRHLDSSLRGLLAVRSVLSGGYEHQSPRPPASCGLPP